MAAVQHAVSLAERFSARVDLIYVEPVAIPADVTQLPIRMEHEQHKNRAQRSLGELNSRVIPSARQGKAVVRSGAPYHEIVAFAEERRTDLIVMPTRGNTGLKHVLLGSTTERVIRHAPCSVLTLHQKSLAGSKLEHVKRVLVATDFSPHSKTAIDFGAAWANEFGATLTLCHVIEPPNYPQFGYVHVAMVEAKRRTAVEGQVEKIRQRLKMPLKLVIRTGAAADEISAEAVRMRADLVVVGTHGHKGLAHILLGSTAERVVRHTKCAVLVARQKRK
jgi:nucleotide-binding universal stress UspA family protein